MGRGAVAASLGAPDKPRHVPADHGDGLTPADHSRRPRALPGPREPLLSRLNPTKERRRVDIEATRALLNIASPSRICPVSGAL